MPNRDYQGERREYDFSQLNREDMHLDPFLQLQEWLDYAHKSEIKDPTAMALSTVDSNSQPHSRIVLLKEFTSDGLVFYTDYDSAKGQEINLNPRASILFFWPEIDRQVRIEGVIKKTSRSHSVDYFKTRPLGSQFAASISEQSKIIPGRKTLELNFLIAENDFNGKEVPCPDNWGGYCLKPNLFEFWQGRESRLHDRFQFKYDAQHANMWGLERLSP